MKSTGSRRGLGVEWRGGGGGGGLGWECKGYGQSLRQQRVKNYW